MAAPTKTSKAASCEWRRLSESACKPLGGGWGLRELRFSPTKKAAAHAPWCRELGCCNVLIPLPVRLPSWHAACNQTPPPTLPSPNTTTHSHTTHTHTHRGLFVRYATYRMAQEMPGGEVLTGFTRILHRTTYDDPVAKEVRSTALL